MPDFLTPLPPPFAEELVSWFRKHGRSLPWRKEYLPYHVWLSEIMLQQTQMERGVSYFLRWIQRFPSLRDVAEASEEEILKYWEGLGYYRRARNLKAAAEKILERWKGELPQSPEELLQLPGVGEYTAGAIASIAWNRRVPAIDANVERFFARYLDWEGSPKEKGFRRTLASLIEKAMEEYAPREITQALMEFGALCCTPVKPGCERCPLEKRCLARLRHVVPLRPRQEKKKASVRRIVIVGVLQDVRGNYLLCRRPEGEILGGLWEFPGVEVPGKKEVSRKILENFFREKGFAVRVEERLCSVRHSYTVNRVLLEVYRCSWRKEPPFFMPEGFFLISPCELEVLSFHAGGRKILEEIKRRA
ncbi:MAG TPA: A/G-specific adenine glycosylase [Synergistaceae bacterium]|nr:A/G-specific adenine glycosylase [Synergistaceae bacterium]